MITVLFLCFLSIVAWIINAIIPSRALFEIFFRDTVWNAGSETTKVAITFDDGPHPLYTLQILDLLDLYGARATFFFVGKNVEKYPEIAKLICARGHEIGNHTYSHRILPLLSTKQIEREIQRTDNVIQRVTGKKPHFVRPPHGYRDARVLKKLRDMGKKTIFWSVMPYDWANPGVDVIASMTLANVNSGAIILLHDNIETYNQNLFSSNKVGRYLLGVKERNQTVEALNSILSSLQSKGYNLVTVTELLFEQSSDKLTSPSKAASSSARKKAM